MYSYMDEEYPELLDSPDNYYSYQYCRPYQPARYQTAWSNYYNYQYCPPYQPARYQATGSITPGYESAMYDPSWSWMAANRCYPQDICAPLYGWWPGG